MLIVVRIVEVDVEVVVVNVEVVVTVDRLTVVDGTVETIVVV
ncbi:MAG: hypothetical protein ABSF00_03260 [Candidatus Bathyarchaeia archaeon]